MTPFFDKNRAENKNKALSGQEDLSPKVLKDIICPCQTQLTILK